MRPHHSASSVSLVRRCHRAAAYKYIAGLEEPTVTWAEVVAGAPCTPGQRSRALGVAVHEHFERWYRGTLDPAAWTTMPGQIALSGAYYIPAPDQAGAHAVEHAFRVRAEGVTWKGYVDLWLCDKGLIVDYKTSSDISRYALTAEELASDLQAALYVAATGTERVRWVYMQTRAPRRALAVDARIPLARARSVVAAAAADAQAFDRYAAVEDAPQNPASCNMFGGCFYHHSRGGPCDVMSLPSAFIKPKTRPIKALINGGTMPLTASKIEELKRAAADVAPAKGSVTATEAPEPDADASVDKGQVSRGRKKRPRGRPRKNQTPVVNNGTGPEAILAAQDELREACAEVAAAAEKRDAIVARIGELCQG